MSKILTKSNLIATIFAIVAVLTSLIFYKTTNGATPIVASTCGFMAALFITAIEFVYLNVIKGVKHKYITEEIVGAVIGAIIMAIILLD